jgi:hypothetical protein
MARLAPVRVRLWDIDPADRGRGDLAAVIEDASDVGVSAYANEPGEAFFTIPWDHPQIDACQPLERHYEVSRLNSEGTYDVIGVGLLEDYDASENEVVFYGVDYLGLYTKNITANNLSYTSTLIGSIIAEQFTQVQGITHSPFGFIERGTIDATSRTVTVITTFEQRLYFWQGLLAILAAGGTTRPIMWVSRTSDPFTFNFDANRGSDKTDIRLEYGGAINRYGYAPGFSNLATYIRAIGVKREGATVLYSTQTYGDPSTYGALFMAALHQDLINQSELDDRALSDLKNAYERSGNLYMSLAQDYVAPWDGWDLGDSVRVLIRRGIVQINELHTIWGMEWIGRSDGSENLYLDLQPKLV